MSRERLPLVKMDGLLISQVVQNLLENAGHHTPPGTEGRASTPIIVQGSLRITVSDNGLGIPPGQEKEIFNKFATFSHGDKPEGRGPSGLSICQAIAIAHHGKILGRKQAGGGAQFTIELPQKLIVHEERE